MTATDDLSALVAEKEKQAAARPGPAWKRMTLMTAVKELLLSFSLCLALCLSGCVAVDLGLPGLGGTVSASGRGSKKSFPANFASLEEGKKITQFLTTRAATKLVKVDGKLAELTTGNFLIFHYRNRWGTTGRSMIYGMLFEENVQPPVLLSMDVRSYNRGGYTFKFVIPGGHFGIHDVYGGSSGPEYFWFKGEDTSPDWEPSASLSPLPAGMVPDYFVGGFTNVMVYQNGNYSAAFIDGRLVSEGRVGTNNDQGTAGFETAMDLHTAHDVTLRNAFVATGRLAWWLMESITDSRKVKDSGANPYESKFDIDLSGGVNKAKSRSINNKNKVAEARTNYQTVDLKVAVRPAADTDLTFPMYVNVTYEYSYSQHIKTKHFLLGDIEKDVVTRESEDRQYLLESPSSVVQDVYSFEYLLTGINSDMADTVDVRMTSDPVIDVNVTGVAQIPNN
jgi:hypothetical protein